MLDPHRHPAADEPAVEAGGGACKPGYDDELWGGSDFKRLVRAVLSGIKAVGVTNPEDQQDLISEGLCKAWQTPWLRDIWGTLPPEEFQHCFDYVLVRAGRDKANEFLSRRNRQKRDPSRECSIDDTMHSYEDPDAGLFDVRDQLHAALSKLPSRDRDVLVFCDLEGLSHAAVAARIGLAASKEDQVTTIRKRALGKARRVVLPSLENDL